MGHHHDQPTCYGCGEDNPASMGLRFEPDGAEGLIAQVTLDARFDGAPGVVHGGALMVMFDEAFGMLSRHLDRDGVTANLSVDCRTPAARDTELRVRSWLERIDGRKLYLRGDICDGERLVAEGRGLWIQVDPEHFERARGQLPV